MIFLGLLYSHAFDLDQCVLGQAGCLKCGTGGIGSGEEFGIDRIHGGEVGNVGKQYGGLDHVAHIGTGCSQNGFDVGQTLAGLGGDIITCESAGGGINGQLAGNIDGIACGNGLRVGADGGRSEICMDGNIAHGGFSFVFFFYCSIFMRRLQVEMGQAEWYNKEEKNGRSAYMEIVVLDAATLGVDTDLAPLMEQGNVTVWDNTAPDQVAQRIRDAEVIVSNKVRLMEPVLREAKRLKLICLSATGYDCVDTAYCAQNGIGVCNVPGYSTQSVAQLTVAMVLELVNHLSAYRDYVHSGAYSRSGVANALIPVWHELYGKTWGIVGGGNIGRQVAKIADAFGCKVLVCRRKPDETYETVDLDTLCARADIISVHVPLTEETRGMIGEKQLGLMKQEVILVNVARGAVTDEAALAEAVKKGRIGGLGVDVYSTEPFGEDHPFNSILSLPNVCLTPHTAWGAIETRNRCIAMVAENISAFRSGQRKNRVEQ